MTVRTARLSWVCLSIASGCAPRAAPTPGSMQYTYAIAPPDAGSWILHVEATFEHAPSPRLTLPPDAAGAVRSMVIVDGVAETPLARTETTWLADPCLARCLVRYAIDLQAIASSCRTFDCSRRVGDAIIGPAATWVLRPEPPGDALIRVAVRGGESSRFATGLRRDPSSGYVLRANELGESSYTAFGTLRNTRMYVGGAKIDVALLDAPLAMGDGATIRWLSDSASCVARLFGRFPVDATVFVLPVRDADDVVFGRVMSLTGASVELLFGTGTPPERAHSDWVVVHELFHLGTPSFVGEAHWLEEGLATYYEPILRERAGWISERELWRHFATEMRRGLRKVGDPASLEERDDIDSTYWGGALFALLADVRIRQATMGARSLDDVMRAALAREGDATHRALAADFFRIGDEATGTHVLADLHARYAVSGEAVDLDAVWRSLGVQGPETEPVLREDAPLAAVRRAIAHP
jgi:predicted metalloprotease with PDZ domain